MWTEGKGGGREWRGTKGTRFPLSEFYMYVEGERKPCPLSLCSILTCPAYTGRFCDQDLDGCTELTCFTGVECMDVPAPGMGATCGPCPAGYSGDGLNCIGMSMCCHQSCAARSL